MKRHLFSALACILLLSVCVRTYPVYAQSGSSTCQVTASAGKETAPPESGDGEETPGPGGSTEDTDPGEGESEPGNGSEDTDAGGGLGTPAPGGNPEGQGSGGQQQNPVSPGDGDGKDSGGEEENPGSADPETGPGSGDDGGEEAGPEKQPEPLPSAEPIQEEPGWESILPGWLTAAFLGILLLAALAASGAFRSIRTWLRFQFHKKSRRRFHGILTEEKNFFIHVRDAQGDSRLVQEIIDSTGSLTECRFQIMGEMAATEIPRQSRMYLSYCGGDGREYRWQADAEERKMFRALEKLQGIGDVNVKITCRGTGIDIHLQFHV